MDNVDNVSELLYSRIAGLDQRYFVRINSVSISPAERLEKERMKTAVQIDEKDNVATVTSDVGSGEAVKIISPKGAVILRVNAADAIRFGHKISLANLKRGDRVTKYGEIIGIASENIKVGAWVHTHNLESAAVPTSALGEEQ